MNQFAIIEAPEIKASEQQSTDLVARMGAITRIENDDQQARAVAFIKDAKEFITRVKAEFKDSIASAKKAVSDISALQDRIIGAVVNGERLARDEVNRYETEKRQRLEAQRREQERIAREAAEAQRQAEIAARLAEAQRLEEERIKLSAENDAQDVNALDAIVQAELDAETALEAAQALESAPVYVAPVVVPKTEIDGMATRTDWDFELVDFNLVPNEFKILDAVKIRKIVKAMKDKTRIPGIKAVSKQTMITR